MNSSAGINTFLIPADVWKEGSAPVSERAKRFAESQKFKAGAEQVVIVPDEDGNPAEVLFGLGAAQRLIHRRHRSHTFLLSRGSHSHCRTDGDDGDGQGGQFWAGPEAKTL